MEDAQRRRIRNFVALVIPTVWLCGIVLFEISSGASPFVVSGTVGFALFFATAAYQVRPRPTDRRVLRPIVTGSLLLTVAPLALRAVALLGGDSYVAIGTAFGILAVTILVVHSQVIKVIGAKPAAGHAEGWPIIGGVPREAKDLGGPIQVVLAHALFGSLLAWIAVALSSDAARILAAETLIVVMLVVT